VYHGWKFDTTGACIDMPNEPAESNFKHTIRATAYPCVERNGAVWTYMGPAKAPPPLPDIEANIAEGFHTLAMDHDHNWLQVLEGTIDTIHAGLLHFGSVGWEEAPAGSFQQYVLKSRSAKFEVIDTPAGVCYGAYRDGPPGMDYWRIAQFMMPFYGMSPTGGGFNGAPSSLTAAVPMDDEHTLYVHFIARRATEKYDLLPNTTDWYGRFRSPAQASNDFLLDRELQRSNRGLGGYTGIGSVRNQDRAITSSMGPIVNRTVEHLGQTDLGIIRTRRRLIEAARALAETGATPPGVDNPEFYGVRSGEIFLEKGKDWAQATGELRKAFTPRPA
jgi:phenylpropionate dioxygenase-like ring-hydroxylating dioxygenase large terminal subunit